MFLALIIVLAFGSQLKCKLCVAIAITYSLRLIFALWHFPAMMCRIIAHNLEFDTISNKYAGTATVTVRDVGKKCRFLIAHFVFVFDFF